MSEVPMVEQGPPSSQKQLCKDSTNMRRLGMGTACPLSSHPMWGHVESQERGERGNWSKNCGGNPSLRSWLSVLGIPFNPSFVQLSPKPWLGRARGADTMETVCLAGTVQDLSASFSEVFRDSGALSSTMLASGSHSHHWSQSLVAPETRAVSSAMTSDMEPSPNPGEGSSSQ